MPSKKAIFDSLLLTAIFVFAAGCYAGNALIVAGHVLLIMAIVVGFLGPKLERRGQQRWWQQVSVSTWFVLALVVADLMSILVNLDAYDRPWKDIKKLRHLAIPLLVLLIPIIRESIKSRKYHLGKVAWLTLGGFVCAATIADVINVWTGFHLFRFGPGPSRVNLLGNLVGNVRIGGNFGTIMTYGYSVQVTFLLAAGVVLLFWKKLPKTHFIVVTALVTFLVCGAGLFLSGSRGALLGACFGGALMLLLTRSIWVYATFGVILVAALIAAFAAGKWLVRPNDSVRISQWKTATLTGLNNPIFGIGYRQFEKQSTKLKVEYGIPHDLKFTDPDGTVLTRHLKGHAHNNYFEAFASTGLLGFLSLLGFFLFWIKETWSQWNTRILFVPAIVGFMVSGFFENSFTDGEITALVMGVYVASQFMLMPETDNSKKS